MREVGEYLADEQVLFMLLCFFAPLLAGCALIWRRP